MWGFLIAQKKFVLYITETIILKRIVILKKKVETCFSVSHIFPSYKITYKFAKFCNNQEKDGSIKHSMHAGPYLAPAKQVLCFSLLLRSEQQHKQHLRRIYRREYEVYPSCENGIYASSYPFT